jgi:hypothetical protein
MEEILDTAAAPEHSCSAAFVMQSTGPHFAITRLIYMTSRPRINIDIIYAAIAQSA